MFIVLSLITKICSLKQGSALVLHTHEVLSQDLLWGRFLKNLVKIEAALVEIFWPSLSQKT